ncbi:MAG TPA: Uma2 family endonuclease [Isosphaeraceae bacterium]|jgi:Uma2 family endonuclease
MTSSAVLDPGRADLVAPESPPDADGTFYEVVNGRRVEIPPMSAYAAKVASRLVTELNIQARAHQLGEAVVETLFRLPLAEDRGRNRQPDIAFVSYDRWPVDRPQPEDANAWDVVPDLAVEVISPSNLAGETLDKVLEYLRAGVRLVWVVYPRQRMIFAFESPTLVRALARADTLEGGPVLPGFRLPLANLFDPVQPPRAP